MMKIDPDGQQYIIFMSLKTDGKIEDIAISSFAYDWQAQVFLEGYVTAIVNHTGDASYEDVKGQFSIRDITGQEVKNKPNNKESENGKND